MATRPNGAQAGACPQIAPLSHAIRVGLATSVVAVAFGAGASTLGAQALRGWNPPPPRVSTTIDQAPVVDLSVVSPPKAVRAFPVPAAIDQAAATDIDIDNATPIVVSQPGNVYAIRAASSDGDVLIANRAGGTLEAISPDASAFAIHARGHAVQVGNDAVVRATGAVIANAIDVQAAHGNASVRNSGELVATATGMVSRSAGPNGIRVLSGQGTASIDNSGAVGVSGGGSAVALGASGRTARVANTAALAVRGYASYGIVSGGDVAEADNRGDILADGTLAYGVRVFGAERATLANTGDIDVRATLGGTGLYAGNALSDGTVALTSDGAITVRSANATGISLRGGTVTANVDGSIAALDGTHGIGIAAGARRDVTIDSDADIDVSGTVRATAIEARSTEGPIQLRNGGSLRATSQGDAYGIDAQADAGLVEITNTGAIEAKGGREAFALYAHGDHVRVSNSGALDVAGSVGMGIFAHGDVAEVDNSGDVSIRAYSSRVAYGVRVVGLQGADVVNTGDIDVRGGDIVTGLSASDALGGARVALSTDATILARSSSGATGVWVSGDEVEATTAGSITAQGISGVATGIGASAQQSLSLANSADVLASTGQMWSSGIDASLGGGGTLNLHNEGSIVAEALRSANSFGIQARAADGSIALVNDGVIDVRAEGGTAVGIFASGRDVQLANTGAIDTHGFGIEATGATVAVTNSGAVRALTGNRTRTGLRVHGTTTAQVQNTGTVEIGLTSATGTGMRVTGGAVSVGNSGTISVSEAGWGASGIEANGATVAIRNEGEIAVKGDRYARYAATGVVAKAQGDVSIANTGTIHVQELAGDYNPMPAGAVGVSMESIDGTATLENSGTISAVHHSPGQRRPVFAVVGGTGDNVIRNRGMIEGAITTSAGDDLFENAKEGTWLLGGEYSASHFGVGSNRIANAGTITADGWHRVYLGSGRFDNTGVIDLVDDATDDSLTIYDATFGGTGAINIDLDPVAGRSDYLGVGGDMAADAVQTVNIKVPGVPTTVVSAPVEFAAVAGTSVAGNFVGGQVLGWDPANFLRLGVIVSSDIDATNKRPDRFLASTYVAGLNDAGALASMAAVGVTSLAHTQIGTLRQRLGAGMLEDPERRFGVFLRGYVSQGDVDPGHRALDFDQGGNFLHDQSTWGRELGVGVRLAENLHGGLLFGKANSRQRLASPGVGENRFRGNTQGGYLTWYQPNGFYLDLSARTMDVDIRSTSGVGGWGGEAKLRAYSVEAGYEWEWEGLTWVPQAQYTRAEATDVAPFQGPAVALVSDGARSSRGRLGLEVKKTIVGEGIRVTPFLSLSAVHEFDGRADYTVANAFHGTFERTGTSSLIGLGLDVQKGALGFSIGSQWTYGGANDNASGAQAIIRYSW